MKKSMIAICTAMIFMFSCTLVAHANNVSETSYMGIEPEPVILDPNVEDGVMSNPDAEENNDPSVNQSYFECDTGQVWTTVDGVPTMLDGKGNPVGQGENYLVIDVSQYQEEIDWDAVKNGGIDGVIIRATSYAGGSIHEDAMFAENIQGAMSVGLPVGVYVYSYAETASEALYEANVLIEILKDNNIEPDDLTLGVYYDLESNDYTKDLDPEDYEPIVSTFIGRLGECGYSAHVYSYKSYLESNLDSPYIHSQTTWVAQYSSELTFNNEYVQPGLVGWQYQSDGNIPGVQGNCDVNCFWIYPGYELTADITSYQIEGDRVAILADETLYVKDGGIYKQWTKVASGVKDFQLEGNRIAVLRTDGTLSIKEGSLTSSWVNVKSNVSDFQLEGNRVGVVSEGALYVKEGALTSTWVKEKSNITDFQLEGKRIGVISEGALYVKEGSLTSTWVKVRSSVTDFQLEGDRIGVVSGGALYVKDGALNAGWVKESSSVTDFQLEGDRIGIVSDGALYVKEGSLNASWVKVRSSVTDFQLEGDRIGIVSEGDLYVKDGALNAGWVKERSNVESFQLEGNTIAVHSNGKLYAKEGDLYAPWINMNLGFPEL